MYEYLLYIGLLAGILQACGYVMYYLLVINKDEKNAEPLSWFMFAYGTALLTIMELDSMLKASLNDNSWLTTLSVLLLPIICSLGGILVAASIWLNQYKKTRRWWPEKWKIKWNDTDGKAFAADLGLTVVYSILWIFTLSKTTTDNEHLWWVIAFLIISNLTTLPNFVPILRETAKYPEREAWQPWAVWTIAYTLLLVPTWIYSSNGIIWPSGLSLHWDVSFYLFLALMSYPVVNILMHGLMAIFASRRSMMVHK